MKLLQNVYPLVGIVLLLNGGILLSKNKGFSTKNEALQAITSVHTKVFSQDNLFAKANRETGDWYEMLSNIQSYVDKNAGGNENLLKASALCKHASDQLINTLQKVYYSIFAGKKSPSDFNIINALGRFKLLNEQKDNLEATSNILENTSYFFNKKKEVKEVLLRLMLTLVLTIEKLDRDFHRL